MLKGMKVSKYLKSYGSFCINCVFRTGFTLHCYKAVKIVWGFTEAQYQDLKFYGI
jgi:hypothetical protein